jgi:hypothetical protein
MTNATVTPARMNCPCCGYATLSARNAYNICKLCNWEDDAQGDEDADEVRGSPNAHYSLTEARANFKRYRVMYPPGRDPRMSGASSRLEFDIKGCLMAAFERLRQCRRSAVDRLDAEIAGLEQALYDETLRRVLEYDRVHLGASQEAGLDLAPPKANRASPTRIPAAGRWMRSLRKLVAAFAVR